MTDPATVAKAAALLTREQVWHMKRATVTSDGRWHVKSNSLTKAGPWPEGLTQYYSWALDSLTPLGLAVRNLLEQPQ